MAKINVTVEIDTEEGTMDVTLNGKKVPSVTGINCYTYEDMDREMCATCTISAAEKDEEGGLAKITTYYAMSSEEAKHIVRASADHSIPDFIGKIEHNPTNDIHKFFASKSLFGRSGV